MGISIVSWAPLWAVGMLVFGSLGIALHVRGMHTQRNSGFGWVRGYHWLPVACFVLTVACTALLFLAVALSFFL